MYCASRLALISPFVQQRVQALASQALPLLARNGCEHLLRVSARVQSCSEDNRGLLHLLEIAPHRRMHFQRPYKREECTAFGICADPEAFHPPWDHRSHFDRLFLSLRIWQVGQLEAQLFEQFFSASSASSSPTPVNGSAPPNGSNGKASGSISSGPTAATKPATEQLVQVMEPLCGALYDVLRPLVVQLQDIDELCELVDILKHEVGALCQPASHILSVSVAHAQACMHVPLCAFRCWGTSSVDGDPAPRLWCPRSAARWQTCRPGSSSDVR